MFYLHVFRMTVYPRTCYGSDESGDMDRKWGLQEAMLCPPLLSVFLFLFSITLVSLQRISSTTSHLAASPAELFLFGVVWLSLLCFHSNLRINVSTLAKLFMEFWWGLHWVCTLVLVSAIFVLFIVPVHEHGVPVLSSGVVFSFFICCFIIFTAETPLLLWLALSEVCLSVYLKLMCIETFPLLSSSECSLLVYHKALVSFMPLCIWCACVSICVLDWIWALCVTNVHAYVCTCLWRPEVDDRLFSSTLLIEAESLKCIYCSLMWVSWLTNSTHGSLCISEQWNHWQVGTLFLPYAYSKPQSSRLHSRCFNPLNSLTSLPDLFCVEL